MGACQSTEEIIVPSQLRTINSPQRKILLLGIQQTGKTTLFRQFQRLFGDGIPLACKEQITEEVQMKLIEDLRVILSEHHEDKARSSCIVSGRFLNTQIALSDLFRTIPKDQWCTNELFLQLLQTIAIDISSNALNAGFLHYIQSPGIDCSANLSRYLLLQSQRILSRDYIPTDFDMLHFNSSTFGIDSCQVFIQGQSLNFVDIGGHMSQRWKWIHCFDDTLLVMFCVDLCSYDLFENDKHKLTMLQESLQVFEDLCNTVWLKQSQLAVVLTKKDLFARKVISSPIENLFPEFSVSQSSSPLEFIKNLFEDRNKNRKGKIVYISVNSLADDDVSHLFYSLLDLVDSGSFEA